MTQKNLNARTAAHLAAKIAFPCHNPYARPMENQIQGPAWDLASEYESTDAVELETDLNQVMSICDEIEKLPGTMRRSSR